MRVGRGSGEGGCVGRVGGLCRMCEWVVGRLVPGRCVWIGRRVDEWGGLVSLGGQGRVCVGEWVGRWVVGLIKSFFGGGVLVLTPGR